MPATTQASPVQTTPGGRKWRWFQRPAGRPNGWGGAVLQIGAKFYKAEATFAEMPNGQPIIVADLRCGPAPEEHYRITVGPEVECDCPHATYRGKGCKHAEVMPLALAWLEEAERQEWSDSIRQPDPAGAPF